MKVLMPLSVSGQNISGGGDIEYRVQQLCQCLVIRCY